MPHYYAYKPTENGGFLLVHSDGADYCPNRLTAEQKLQSSIHSWAREDSNKARQEMEVLTRLIRSI